MSRSPDPPKLKTFVRFRLPDAPYYEVSGATLPETVESLIDKLDESGGWVAFLKLVKAEFPYHATTLDPIIRQVVTPRSRPQGKPIEERFRRLGDQLNSREGVVANVSGLAALLIVTAPLLDRMFPQADTNLIWNIHLSFGGLLALVSAASMIRVWRRRSRLLRPDRFVIQPEDPNCFIGREIEVHDLQAECEKQPLVFLLGESGTGKSTLARVGLLPRLFLQGPQPPRLVPLRVGASTLAWVDGLGTVLSAVYRGSIQRLMLDTEESRDWGVSSSSGMSRMPPNSPESQWPICCVDSSRWSPETRTRRLPWPRRSLGARCAVSALGEALGRLIAKLEPMDVQLGAAAIVRRMENDETNSEMVRLLGDEFLYLTGSLASDDQLELCVHLLKSPRIVGTNKDNILKHVDNSSVFGEMLSGGVAENFDIWKFVDWAQDPARGGEHHLNLSRSPSEPVEQTATRH